VRDAAWGCDWMGTPVPFQRCLTFIIATANKEFTLTAGKFVPVSNKTMMNVSTRYSAFTECVHNAYIYPESANKEERSNALIFSGINHIQKQNILSKTDKSVYIYIYI
jgi:3-deoxy-D-manno-octulosonic acid (KDO) 8-phosphate synthase